MSIDVVSDKTNRLYVVTKKHPEGELIMGKEVDKWLTTTLKAYRKEVLEELLGLTTEKLVNYKPKPNITFKAIKYDDLFELITKLSKREK